MSGNKARARKADLTYAEYVGVDGGNLIRGQHTTRLQESRPSLLQWARSDGWRGGAARGGVSSG